MPLTGFDKAYEKKRGVEVSVDSIGSAGGSGYFPPVTQKQGIVQPPVETTNTLHKAGQSEGSGMEAAMETVKDVMALKMLEKVLEAVTEILK